MSDHEYEVVVDKKEGIARVRETAHSIARHRLGKWEKRIFNYLSDVCIEAGTNRVAVSRGQLSDVLDNELDRRNIKVVLDSLERKGYIKKQNQQSPSGLYLENIYTVFDPLRLKMHSAPPASKPEGEG